MYVESLHSIIIGACSDGGKSKMKEARSGPKVRPNRMKVSTEIPSMEVLAAIKHKKKVCIPSLVNSWFFSKKYRFSFSWANYVTCVEYLNILCLYFILIISFTWIVMHQLLEM